MRPFYERDQQCEGWGRILEEENRPHDVMTEHQPSHIMIVNVEYLRNPDTTSPTMGVALERPLANVYYPCLIYSNNTM